MTQDGGPDLGENEGRVMPSPQLHPVSLIVGPPPVLVSKVVQFACSLGEGMRERDSQQQLATTPTTQTVLSIDMYIQDSRLEGFSTV